MEYIVYTVSSISISYQYLNIKENILQKLLHQRMSSSTFPLLHTFSYPSFDPHPLYLLSLIKLYYMVLFYLSNYLHGSILPIKLSTWFYSIYQTILHGSILSIKLSSWFYSIYHTICMVLFYLSNYTIWFYSIYQIIFMVLFYLLKINTFYFYYTFIVISYCDLFGDFDANEKIEN